MLNKSNEFIILHYQLRLLNLRLFRQLLILLFLLFTAVNLSSQTKLCEIKLTNGKTLTQTRMVGLHDNLLLVTSDSGNFRIINVEKVANVKFDVGTYMWTGAAIGAVAGFVGGLVYYEIFNGTKKKSFLPKDAAIGTVLVLTLPCAVIGGVVGLLFRNIDDYDLSKLNSFTKSKELKFIMKDHDMFP